MLGCFCECIYTSVVCITNNYILLLLLLLLQVMRRLMKTENCLVEAPPTDAPEQDKFLKWSALDP